ncbi:MAG: sensor histidine kinase [Pirellulales bacterium]
MRLTAKLVTMLVVAMAIMLAIDGYLAIRRDVAHFEEMSRLRADFFVEVMRVLWRSGPKGPKEVLALIQRINQRQEIVHFGYVDLRKGLDPELKKWLDEPRRKAVTRGELVSAYHSDREGNQRYYMFALVTLTKEGKGQQLVGVEMSFEPWPYSSPRLRGVILHILMMTGLMILLGAMFVYFLGREIVGRPLNRLIEKTRRIGSGDLSEPLLLRGKDELSELARALNQMCKQLDKSQEKARREETARMAAMEQLRHVDRLRTVGGLASGMAHELGTPLNVVSGRAGLIASGKLATGEVRASAEAIKAESQRMATIIRQLLDFARRSTPQRTDVDVRQIADQTVVLLDALARKQQVTLDLVGDATSVPAHVDPGQIQQVLTNLIVNGIQAMPEGGRIAIDVRHVMASPQTADQAEERAYVRIDVKDEGSGIAAEDIEHLFEPFFTTKEIGEGTGLGLSIAYGIVEEHAGWIDVWSEPGEGSLFSVYLPKEPNS